MSALYKDNGDPDRKASGKRNQRVSFPATPNSPFENKGKVSPFPNFGDAPMGGTTGLCHQNTAAIDEAARWLASSVYPAEQPIIPALRRRFGLTAHEAVCAIVEARRA